jgi:hypothetical protein
MRRRCQADVGKIKNINTETGLRNENKSRRVIRSETEVGLLIVDGHKPIIKFRVL